MSVINWRALMDIPSARQIIAARALLGINQEKMAEGSGVAVATIRRFEASGSQAKAEVSYRVSTMLKLISFLESRGIQFLFEEDAVGVKLNK
jgi:predicted transcriptional regulator